MIILSTNENLGFLIKTLDAVLDELKINVTALKSIVNIKREQEILKKIQKYISKVEELEPTQFKFLIEPDQNDDVLLYEDSNNSENAEKQISDAGNDFLSDYNPISLFKSTFLSPQPVRSPEPNTPPSPVVESSDSEADVFSENSDNEFHSAGYLSSRFNNTLKSAKSDSFYTIKSDNTSALSLIDQFECSSVDDNLTNVSNVIPDCMILNVMYQDENKFLLEFTNSFKQALKIYNEIIIETKKFEISIKNELKDIMDAYNIRDKKWNKIHSNLIKNTKNLHSALGPAKPPYELEGSKVGVVSGLGTKAILSYIRYVNSNREWVHVTIKAKRFLIQIEDLFVRLLAKVVNFYKEKIYNPSTQIFNIFSELSDRNESYSIHGTFSDDIYDECLIKHLPDKIKGKFSSLRKIRSLLNKYYSLRYEKLVIVSKLILPLPSVNIKDSNVSDYFLGLKSYFDFLRNKFLYDKVNLYQKAILSNSSNLYRGAHVMSLSDYSLETFINYSDKNLAKNLPSFLNIFITAVKPFKDLRMGDVENLLKLTENLDLFNDVEQFKKEGDGSEELETEDSDTCYKNPLESVTPMCTERSIEGNEIKLISKWLDPDFYATVKDCLSEEVKEYSKSYKFQAKARLCYNYNDLNMRFSKGDIIKVYEPLGDIWWGSFNGLDGPFPAKCLDTRWIEGIKVDYDKPTDLDMYIDTSTVTEESLEFNDAGISLFNKFKIPENCITSYSCALQKKILLQGKLYISKNYLAFTSHFNDSTLFGEATTITIPIASIKNVKSGKAVITQSIEIECVDSVYTFASFLNRNKVIDFIKLLVKINLPDDDDRLSLDLNPQNVNIDLKIPKELFNIGPFSKVYKKLDNSVFTLQTSMSIEDAFLLLFDLSRPPFESIREAMKFNNMRYSLKEGDKERIDPLDNYDGLRVKYPDKYPSIEKRVLYYSIPFDENSYAQMIGISNTHIIETISFYFIDEFNILVESKSKITGIPFSDYIHPVWHIILRSTPQRDLCAIHGLYQVFVDQWIPFSGTLMSEAHQNIKKTLKMFANIAYKKMST